MSAKYMRVPTQDPGQLEEVAIDFSSPFTYERPIIQTHHDKKYPKYFSYTNESSKYRSMFTYGGEYQRVKPGSGLENGVQPGIILNIFATLVTFVCYATIFLTFPISWWFCMKKVKEHERMVVFRIGKLLATKNPGRVIVLPCIDQWTMVDIRTKAFSVPPMQLITADSGIIECGADIFYQIKDPVLSIAGVQDLNQCQRVMSQTTLQKLLVKRDLGDIEREKPVIAGFLRDELNKGVAHWGVYINKVEISQVKILREAQQTNPVLAGLTGKGGDSSNPLQFLGSLLASAAPRVGGSGAAPSTVPGASPMVSQQSLQDMGLLSAFMPPPASSAAPTTKPTLMPIQEVEAPLEETDKPGRFVTPREIVSVTSKLLTPDLVQDVGAILKFVVIGGGGGTFYLDLKNGSGSVGEGEPPGGAPDTTITLTFDDLQQLFQGHMSAFNGYMSGRLAVEGDLGSARRLQHLVDKIQSNLV